MAEDSFTLKNQYILDKILTNYSRLVFLKDGKIIPVLAQEIIQPDQENVNSPWVHCVRSDNMLIILETIVQDQAYVHHSATIESQQAHVC